MYATKALWRFSLCIDLFVGNGTARQQRTPVNRWCKGVKPKASVCVCVSECWDCTEHFRVSSPLADKMHFICTEIGSADLADKWFCIVYQSYAILYVWHVACAQMFIRTEPHVEKTIRNATRVHIKIVATTTKMWPEMGKLVKHNRYMSVSIKHIDADVHSSAVHLRLPEPIPTTSTYTLQW